MKIETTRLVITLFLSGIILIAWQSYRHGSNDNNSITKKVTIKAEITKEVKINKETPTGFIVTPLNNVLDDIYKRTGNLGWSIIILTIMLKLLLSPVQFFMIRASKRMEAIQPCLKKIKTKFKNDFKKQQEETLKIFKEKKVNPFSTMLPMLIS